MTISSQEVLLPTLSLLLSRKKNIYRKFHVPSASKEHMRRGTMYSRMYVYNRWTQAGIRCPISTTFNFISKRVSWRYMLSLDQKMIPPFSKQHLTTWGWEDQPKTPMCSTTRRTRKTLLQQRQSLRDQHQPLYY